MNYISSRGKVEVKQASEVIKMGISPDGGLFCPEQIPIFLNNPDIIKRFQSLDYKGIAQVVFSMFLSDFDEYDIEKCINEAYSKDKFDTSYITPLVKLGDSSYVLELWHGPTAAFKDIALQILPHFMTTALKKTGEDKEIVILVATSGDTGKAALEGFKDVKGTKIIVFYPQEGVSEVQRLQMITQAGENTHVVAISGNFDDAQTAVKKMFVDQDFSSELKKKNYKLSSANSINWGRLLPQVVYYIYAYFSLVKAKEISMGEKLNIVVPTGNFGNILAAFYAKKMGLPINRLICASNTNNILTDFINTGVYDCNRPFYKTVSPSMDILISSNLERLLFELSGHDYYIIRSWMGDLSSNNRYKVDKGMLSKIQRIFWADYASDQETLDTIKDVYKEFNYLMDTHTAVAVNVLKKYIAQTKDNTKTVIASTASPFKFADDVLKAIYEDGCAKVSSEYEMINILSKKTGVPIPEGLRDLDEKEILHDASCNKNNFKQTVKDILSV
ncbi:MAG: threonine synthase [Clostridia bacterium]|nr:threonine synthase [Clostridia bacterium]